MSDWFLPSESAWARFCFDAAWQSTGLGIAAFVAARTLAKQPATRAFILLIGLVVCVTAPMSSAAARAVGLGLFTIQAAPTIISASHESRDTTLGLSSPPIVAVISHTPNRPTSTSHAVLSYVPVMAMVWAAFTFLLLGRLALCSLAAFRLSRHARPCHDPEILQAAALAARKLGFEVVPTVSVSAAIACPMVFAFGRPRLLIPDSRGVSALESWMAVFCHELAHVKRKDGWGRLAAETFMALLPWQPLVWLLKRDYYDQCDQACDDWAVWAGVPAIDLADILQRWIPRSVPRMASAMASYSRSSSRIIRLLDMRSPHLATFSRLRHGVIAMIALSVCAALAFAQERKAATIASANVEVTKTRTKMLSPEDGVIPYVIEPPDILMLETVKLVPKNPPTVHPFDTLDIRAVRTLIDQPISGTFKVDASGRVALGPSYGKVVLTGLTVDEATAAVEQQLKRILKNPAVSLEFAEDNEPKIAGQYLVAPDGTIKLAMHGRGYVYVAGMTLDEAEEAIESALSNDFEKPQVSVDVYAANSKVFYVIIENASLGDRIFRMPWAGKTTVLDAVSQAGDLRITSNTKIKIARPSPGGFGKDQIFNVDWPAALKSNKSPPNYKLLPGDRVFVTKADELDGKDAKGRNKPATGVDPNEHPKREQTSNF